MLRPRFVQHLGYNIIYSVAPTNSPHSKAFFFFFAKYDVHKRIYDGYNDTDSHRFQYSCPKSRLFW